VATKVAKLAYANKDLIGLVCKQCAVAFAAIDCAVKRTVAGCVGAFAGVVMPAGKKIFTGIKAARAAKKGATVAKSVGRIGKAFNRAKDTWKRVKPLYEFGKLPIDKWKKRRAAYNDIRDGWQ